MYVLKEIIQKYGLNAKKSLGQNFILDGNLLDKIARLALQNTAGEPVLEIGAGPGGLTHALLENGVKNLTVVERDDRCVAALHELKDDFPECLHIIGDDALKFNEQSLGNPLCIVSNLPYNISTVLLVKWLKNISCYSKLTLMFQKEVAERLMAGAGDDAYGRLSVLTNWLCDVVYLMTLPPSAFTPAPKVYSSLVCLTPKKNPATGFTFETMEKLTAAAFGQRRKMLRSSLKSVGNPEELCAAAGIETTLRAEDVPVEAYCKMAAFLEKKE